MDLAITPSVAKVVAPLTSKLVAKIFQKESGGAGLVGNPVRISSYVSFKGEKSVLTEAEIQNLVTRLVENATTSSPHEYREIGDEQEAIAGALYRTLLSLGQITMSDLQAVELGYQDFATELRRVDPHAASDLSGDAESLYDNLLEVCCLYILNFFTSRSTFIQRTQVENSRRIARQSRQLAALTSRIPSQNSADIAFEESYAEAVKAEHGKVRIFGLDLDRSRGRGWDLDTAYLNLEAARPETDQNVETHGELDTEAWSASSAPQRVDEVLRERPRVLLRGQAGAGKSTLIQWLAVSSAFGSFSEELASLNYRIPFVLRMRKMSRQGVLQPRPAQFLEVDDNLRAESQPDGWADRVLRSGRALLLIDGMDEVSSIERDEARDWLERLLALYPETRTVVTVRPAAVPPGWLKHLNFEELSLCPMSPEDREVFIQRWHSAALSFANSDGEGFEGKRESQELTALQESLLRSLGSSPDLSALTDSPLLCAMICALHREWDGTLPKRRMDVYRAALSMLLVRRDQQRRVKPSEGTNIGEEEQLAILQKIAAWLVINQKVEGEHSRAVDQVNKLLPSLPDVQRSGSADRVFSHLVNRSGLIRETSVETFDFIHRTFQDYLAAKEFKEEKSFGLLASKAESDQWTDVIRMAVGHCDPIDRGALIKEIITKAGKANAEGRRRIYLLLGSCLTYASRLDNHVRAQVLEAVKSIMPPQENEADQWAMVGEPVLPLLAECAQDGNFQHFHPHIAVLAAGNEAIPYLRELVHSGHPDRVHATLQEWSAYDVHLFASRVMAGADLSQCRVTADTRARLQEIPSLGRLKFLHCVGNPSQDDVDERLGNLNAGWLVLSGDRLRDISFLSNARDLRGLSLFDCGQLNDLSPVKLTHIKGLYVNDVGSNVTGADVSTIACQTSSIEILGVPVRSLASLADFSPNPRLRKVLLYSVTDYERTDLLRQAFPNVQSIYMEVEDQGSPLDLTVIRGHSIQVALGSRERPEILGEELVTTSNISFEVEEE
ncbi:ATP-binding protein [Streptomyces tauricus]|uniref:NACHT domain-containing protein n=1 Tax=Streptomyces tauricus TaxID=68274 RepID=UPI00167C33B1|nr:NACHT domain-containing protein [Streptomyces tauricus]GHA33323.1 ATP-binding protein [Streptomyces tauricus]